MFSIYCVNFVFQVSLLAYPNNTYKDLVMDQNILIKEQQMKQFIDNLYIHICNALSHHMFLFSILFYTL